MRTIKKALIIVSFLILLFVGFGFAMAFLFRNSAIDYLKKYLDKHLLTEIQVDNIRFSVLKRFPYATVELNNVVVKSTINFNASDFTGFNTDTLLAAKKVHFEFGLLSLIKGKYKLKNIVISYGKLLTLTDRAGQINYNIWRSEKPGKGEAITLYLQNVTFSNIRLKEVNLAKKLQTELDIKKINLRGDFAGDRFSVNARGIGRLNNFHLNDITLPPNKDFSFDIALNATDGKYRIKKGGIMYSGMDLKIIGYVNPKANNEVDLKIDGDKISLETLLTFLPDKFHPFSNQLNTRGWLTFQTIVKGNFTRKTSPSIVTTFNLNKGSLVNRRTKSAITNISLNGIYSNGKSHNLRSSSLQIKNVSVMIKDQQVNGQYLVQDFKQPFIDFRLQGTIPLNELAGFINSDSLEYVSGDMETNLRINGRINNLDSISQFDLTYLNKKGSILFKNAAFKLKNMKFPLKDINGEIQYNESVELHNFSFLFADNDFLLNGYMKNGLEYLFHKKRHLEIIADVKSDSINIDKLLLNKGENSGDKEDKGIMLPGFLQVDAQLSAKNFIYGKFHATNINCIVHYRPDTLSIQQFNLNSLEGSINGQASAIQDKSNNFNVIYNSNLQHININQLFYTFNNFSQDVILDKNMKGIVSGNVNLRAKWDNKLKIYKESVVALCDIEIQDGELINFEPVMGLSRFIEVDELKDIRFKTLKNQISIRDQTVTIPQMDIHSSAFDISGSGIHHFDDSYEYRLRVLLSDLLFNKAKKRKKENSEFGVVEDDGLGRTSLYLTIKGKGSDFKVSYDKKKAFARLTESFRLQKKELKDMLNPNLKENETYQINNPKESGKSKEFILDWEDSRVKKDTIFEKKDKATKTKKPEFIIKWDDDTATDSIK